MPVQIQGAQVVVHKWWCTSGGAQVGFLTEKLFKFEKIFEIYHQF
jgi:hypothetical protein